MEHREAGASEGDWGDVEDDWVEIKEIDGIIQNPSEDPQTHRGQEEIAEYKGFFVPTFEIPRDDAPNYRIRNEITIDGATFTRYFRFAKIDRNLIIDNTRHHYEFDLELQVKWTGDE